MTEIWTAQGEPTCAFAVVERFQISPTLHAKFGMPVLVRPFGETVKVVVSTMVRLTLDSSSCGKDYADRYS
jgi:hypothetical protein